MSVSSPPGSEPRRKEKNVMPLINLNSIEIDDYDDVFLTATEKSSKVNKSRANSANKSQRSSSRRPMPITAADYGQRHLSKNLNKLNHTFTQLNGPSAQIDVLALLHSPSNSPTKRRNNTLDYKSSSKNRGGSHRVRSKRDIDRQDSENCSSSSSAPSGMKKKATAIGMNLDKYDLKTKKTKR